MISIKIVNIGDVKNIEDMLEWYVNEGTAKIVFNNNMLEITSDDEDEIKQILSDGGFDVGEVEAKKIQQGKFVGSLLKASRTASLLETSSELEKIMETSSKETAGGVGMLGGDANDILEGIILTNTDKTDAELIAIIKADSFLMDEIKEMGITDNDLISYIKDTKMIFGKKETATKETAELKVGDKIIVKHINMQNEPEFLSATITEFNDNGTFNVTTKFKNINYLTVLDVMSTATKETAMNEDELKKWKECGFTKSEALKWQENWFDNPKEAKEYKDYGLSPEDAKIWSGINMDGGSSWGFDPGIAKECIDKGISYRRAREMEDDELEVLLDEAKKNLDGKSEGASKETATKETASILKNSLKTIDKEEFYNYLKKKKEPNNIINICADIFESGNLEDQDLNALKIIYSRLIEKNESTVANEIKSYLDKQTASKETAPMGEYKDFADCVSKNKDKEDPEAYCGSIKQKVEGEKETTEFKIGDKLQHYKFGEVILKSIDNTTYSIPMFTVVNKQGEEIYVSQGELKTASKLSDDWEYAGKMHGKDYYVGIKKIAEVENENAKIFDSVGKLLYEGSIKKTGIFM